MKEKLECGKETFSLDKEDSPDIKEDNIRG
jgi:hypothetical protein